MAPSSSAAIRTPPGRALRELGGGAQNRSPETSGSESSAFLREILAVCYISPVSHRQFASPRLPLYFAPCREELICVCERIPCDHAPGFRWSSQFGSRARFGQGAVARVAFFFRYRRLHVAHIQRQCGLSSSLAFFVRRRGRNGFPPRAEAGREQARPVNPAASACLAGVRLPFAMGSRRAWELNGSGSGVGCLLI